MLNLANMNFKKFKNIILFLGRNGKNLLNDSMKKWEFEHIEKKSLTSEDSFLVKIYNLKKL